MKIFWVTFISIFLAELADKTQLVNLSMASRSQNPWLVAVASILGYGLVTVLTVLISSFLSKTMPQEFIHLLSGIIFILIGIFIILEKI